MIRYMELVLAIEALLLGAHGFSFKHLYPAWAQGEEIRGATKDYPCPPSDQIAPCICTVDGDTMEMDCSDVESGDKLQQVFHSTPPFPFDHFTKFIMDGNPNVKALENGVFNRIKFDEIEITNCAINEIQEGSILESADTVKKLTLYSNMIERFLMNDEPDMSSFTQLWRLHLGGNAIGVFPDITSNTITELLLNANPIHTIHDENLKNVPNLEKLDISEINMEVLETKLLTDHLKLKTVSLNNNKLTDIEATTLMIESEDMKMIDLSNNRISDVEPDAFDMDHVEGVTINFENNQLVTLDEATWKPLIGNGSIIKLADNPLACGCDIAWAMLADDGIDYIGAMTGAHCPNANDGEGLDIGELVPDWYENFC